MPRASHLGSRLLLASAAILVAALPAEAGGLRGGRGTALAAFSGAFAGASLKRERRALPSFRRRSVDREAEEAPQLFAARSVLDAPSAVPVAPAPPAAPAQPAAQPGAPSAGADPEKSAQVAALRAKEVWSAQCGRVGTLAGSGMGFCVVNAN